LVEKLGLPLSSSAAPGRYTSLLAPNERSSSYSQAEEAKEAKEAKETEDEILVCFASTRPKQEQCSEGDADAMPETYGYALPTIRGYYSGVGDLFSALVLGHYKDKRSLDAAKEEKEGGSGSGSGKTLERAVSLALLGVQIVLLKTHLSTLSLGGDSNNNAGDSDCIPSDDELDKEAELDEGARQGMKDENGDDVEPLRRPARRARRMRLRELRVVQERRALMDLADDEDVDAGWKGKMLIWDALLREEEVSR
jgi:pyridoxine kinase